MTLRGGVKRQAVSLPSAPLPWHHYKARTTELPLVAQGTKKCSRAQGPCTTTMTTMIIDRGRMRTTRRQEDHETTTTGVATTMVCHRMCDYHHYSPEEEERLTTMVTTTGEMAQGEGCHYDTMTRMTAMVTTMQDRLQERSLDKRTTTSSDYVIRLTDRLRMLRSKILGFFSQYPA